MFFVNFIESTFHNTLCADEVFLQTLVHNSKFRNTLYHNKYDNDLLSIVRYIDWTRGAPYTFKVDDFDELMKSPFLFARKFDTNESYKLIQ